MEDIRVEEAKQLELKDDGSSDDGSSQKPGDSKKSSLISIPASEKAEVREAKREEVKEKAKVLPKVEVLESKTEPLQNSSELDDTADDVNIDLHEANIKRFSPKKPKEPHRHIHLPFEFHPNYNRRVRIYFRIKDFRFR